MLFLTTNVLKFVRFISQTTGRGRGTALPGLIGEKYFYKSLSKLPSILDKIVVITGTNGKTTTAKIIRSILKYNNVKVLSNISGANMTRGILTALAFDTNIFGKVKSKIGIFEVEEASMEKVVKLLNPDIVVITNLFRDQMDAYGELDHTREVIEKGLENMKDDSLVLLNANDPRVVYMNRVCKGKVEYYGLDDINIPTDEENSVLDSTKSPDDRSELIYSKIYFSHMGLYQSKDGKFQTPKLNYSVVDYKQEESKESLPSITFRLLNNTKDKKIFVDNFLLLGLYNVINAVAAFGVIENLGLSSIRQDYSKVSAAFGRGEKIKLKKGVNNFITLILVKNPTGFNSALGAVNDVKEKNIVFALNDNTADGKDVSWIWDCNYEALRDYKKVVVAGKRAYDLALRCKYAEIGYAVADTYEQTIKEFLEYKDDEGFLKIKKDVQIFALCSYTALLRFREYLSTVADIKPIEEEV
ncbi:MAG: MurT ligase domain-containing protein [bacterium]